MDSESRFFELKRYVRFGEADSELLAAFRPIATPHFERIAQEFYDRIREHEGAHAVFTGEAQIGRLERSLVAWLDRLLTGSYDAAYFERTYAIGQVHVRVGLPQRYMVMAMTLIRVELDAIADEALAERAPSTRRALARLLDIDLAVMLEGYRDALDRRAERRSEMFVKGHADALAATRRFEAAVDASPLAIVGIDGQGKIRLWNRASADVTGYGAEDAVGTDFVDTIVIEELREKDRPVVGSLLGSEHAPRSVRLDSVLPTRAGRLREMRWVLVRVDGGLDDIVLFAFGDDVGEARAASERAHRKEKLDAVGTLATGLAHEIRNPLNGALLHVELLERALQQASIDGDALESVSIVGAEIRRLSELLSEILDFARPQPLVQADVDVHVLATRACERFSERAAAESVTLRLDLPKQPLVVAADTVRIDQLLSILLENALDALATRGHGSVVIRARRHPRHAVLEVEDDGPGFPADAPLFDAFYTTKSRGTGLGLAIAQRIATDHEGTLSVTSRPGSTCFRFTLPTSSTS